MTGSHLPFDYVELFLEHARSVNGVEDVTLADYRYKLTDFITVSGLTDIRELDISHALAWTASLRQRKDRRYTKNAAKARTMTEGAIHSYQRPVWVWFNWLLKRGVISIDIPRMVPKTRVRHVTRRVATPEVHDLLVSNALARSEHALRNAALIEVFASTAIRRRELADVMLEDVNLDNGTLYVRHGKNGKPRTIGLGRAARTALLKYIVEKRGREPGPLFLGRGKRPMTAETMRGVLRTLSETAGVRVSSHDFRRGWAVQARKAGVDLGAIKAQLGHETLSMVLIYSEMGEEEGALRAYHEFDAKWAAGGDTVRGVA